MFVNTFFILTSFFLMTPLSLNAASKSFSHLLDKKIQQSEKTPNGHQQSLKKCKTNLAFLENFVNPKKNAPVLSITPARKHLAGAAQLGKRIGANVTKGMMGCKRVKTSFIHSLLKNSYATTPDCTVVTDQISRLNKQASDAITRDFQIPEHRDHYFKEIKRRLRASADTELQMRKSVAQLEQQLKTHTPNKRLKTTLDSLDAFSKKLQQVPTTQIPKNIDSLVDEFNSKIANNLNTHCSIASFKSGCTSLQWHMSAGTNRQKLNANFQKLKLHVQTQQNMYKSMLTEQLAKSNAVDIELKAKKAELESLQKALKAIEDRIGTSVRQVSTEQLFKIRFAAPLDDPGRPTDLKHLHHLVDLDDVTGNKQKMFSRTFRKIEDKEKKLKSLMEPCKVGKNSFIKTAYACNSTALKNYKTSLQHVHTTPNNTAPSRSIGKLGKVKTATASTVAGLGFAGSVASLYIGTTGDSGCSSNLTMDMIKKESGCTIHLEDNLDYFNAQTSLNYNQKKLQLVHPAVLERIPHDKLWGAERKKCEQHNSTNPSKCNTKYLQTLCKQNKKHCPLIETTPDEHVQNVCDTLNSSLAEFGSSLNCKPDARKYGKGSAVFTLNNHKVIVKRDPRTGNMMSFSVFTSGEGNSRVTMDPVYPAQEKSIDKIYKGYVPPDAKTQLNPKKDKKRIDKLRALAPLAKTAFEVCLNDPNFQAKPASKGLRMPVIQKSKPSSSGTAQ